VYINSRANELDVGVVEHVARWVGNMLRTFWLGEGDPSELGWGQLSQDSATVNVSCTSPNQFLMSTEQVRYSQREEVVMPYLRVLSSFRDGVRQLAISRGDGAAKEILALCDKLRDSDLVPLGVALDDQEGRSCLDS
jgi:cysteinyl-tRNA synthetase